MRDGYLALYDTTEIQNYVYGSNKIKDIIGASNLVEKCFSEFLIDTINNLYKEKAKCTYSKNESLQFTKNEELKVEVLYIGGGNALLMMDSIETWKSINYNFGLEMMFKAKGLKFVTDIIKMTNRFSNDLEELFKKINNKKMTNTFSEGMKGLSITRECSVTKNPAVTLSTNNKQAISYEVWLKREADNSVENKIIDDIAGNKGESYIGIVHIDGNDMGKKIKEIIKSEKSYSNAVRKMRTFSEEIKEVFENSYNKMIEESEEVIHGIEADKYSKLFTISDKKITPFRKILIKGDDITYITYGKFAIASLEKYMKNVIDEAKKTTLANNIDACGGIAFVKPHFPFSQGYKIAEECCTNAKTLCRKKNMKKQRFVFDFHIVRGTYSGNLDKVRESSFNTNDDKKSLLWRPYSVVNNQNVNVNNFEHTKLLIDDLNKISRNKIKELRDSFVYGDDVVKMTYEKIKSRGNAIKYNNKEVSIRRGETPLFDTLEFMDLYIDLFKDNGGK